MDPRNQRQCMMERFFGCNRNYSGQLKHVPEDSRLNAPIIVDNYGNHVIQQSILEEKTVNEQSVSIGNISTVPYKKI